MLKLLAVSRVVGIALCLAALGACGAGQKPGAASDLLASCSKRVDAGSVEYRCTDVIARVTNASNMDYTGALERYRDAIEAPKNRPTGKVPDYCGHSFTTLQLGGAPHRVLVVGCSDHTSRHAAQFIDMAVAAPLDHGTRIASCAFESAHSTYQARRERCEEILNALMQKRPASSPSPQ
jgi:hypothetical protein